MPKLIKYFIILSSSNFKRTNTMYRTEEYSNILNLLNNNLLYLKNKSILITGAAGLIGSYLIDFLIYLNNKSGYNIAIYAVSRSKEKIIQKYQDSVIAIEHDLSDNQEFKGNFDYVIHLAGNSHHYLFQNNPVNTMKTNLTGTIKLLEMIKNTNTKFLYISTGAIYGNNTNKALTENDNGVIDSKQAASCYAESKRAAETLCMSYHKQYDININIARLCYVYGPIITKDNNSRLDIQFLQNALNKQDIILKGNGTQKRSYCYISDTVSAILYILLKGQNGEVYNVSNPNSEVTIKKYAEVLAKIAGVNLKIDNSGENNKKHYNALLDSAKLIKLGWNAYYDIYEGLKHTYQTAENNLKESVKLNCQLL